MRVRFRGADLSTFFLGIGFFLFLLSISLTVGFVQVFEGSIRKIKRGNRKSRRKVLARLGIEEGREPHERRTIVGFFHPYCNAGGGGERVLFEALTHHQRQDPDLICVVYTGDVGPLPDVKLTKPTSSDAEFDAAYRSIGETSVSSTKPPSSKNQSNQAARARQEGKVTKDEIIAKVKSRFGIQLDGSRLEFLPLGSRKLVDDGYWKRFTLLGQSLGSTVLAFEAMGQLIPDVFIDTMGYAFTYPTVRMFVKNMPIGSYTHYPTISTDMLARVERREAGHTNNASTASSAWKSAAKLRYYRIFAWVYAWALRRADMVVANGTWTRNHIEGLMYGKSAQANRKASAKGKPGRHVEIVYPPCDTRSLASFPLDNARSGMVSLAQFRPEKEHVTQLRFLRALLDRHPELAQKKGPEQVRLTMMGSCRNEGDEARVEMLRSLAKKLGLEEHVEFVVNAPWSEVVSRLAKASIGISTMVDEHFGINVVEFMAAGLITLSHASAGPLLDIAVAVDHKGTDFGAGRTGYHASTPDDFADRAAEILALDPQEELSIRKRARERAQKVFGTEAFHDSWRSHVWMPLHEKLVGSQRKNQ